jgi:hypothetical protein
MESFAPEVPSWQSNPQRTANLLRNDNIFRRSQFHVSILRTFQFSEYGDTNALCSIYVLKDMTWSNIVDFYHFKKPSKGVQKYTSNGSVSPSRFTITGAFMLQSENKVMPIYS